MASKMVTDRQKSAAKVAKAALVHAQEAADGLAPLLTAELLDGEQLPDLALLQRLLARALQRRAARMVETDEANARELRDDASPRRKREQAALVLRERLVAVRLTSDGVFGIGRSAELFGVGSEMPADPVVLLRLANRLVDSLRQTAVAALPEPRLGGVAVDTTFWVSEIEGPVEALQLALDEVDTQQRKAESTLKAKKEALLTYDGSFLQVARMLEATFAAAGLTALAAKVRPSRRKPGRTADEEGPPVAGDGTPPVVVAPEADPLPPPVAN